MGQSEFENILHSISDEIKNKYPEFTGIYFFGSRVTGNFTEDSDYDIVLVFDGPVDSSLEDQVLSIIYRYEIEHEILFDFSCYNSKDLKDPITPFREKVVKEGRFYAA